jgi:hypothetical protein
LALVPAGQGVLYVYRSAGDVALVPPGLVTVTSTVLALSAGAVAVIDVSLTTVNDVAGVVPKSTAVAAVSPVPVMVTTVPPEVEPLLGLTAVTAGTGAEV